MSDDSTKSGFTTKSDESRREFWDELFKTTDKTTVSTARMIYDRDKKWIESAAKKYNWKLTWLSTAIAQWNKNEAADPR